MDKKKNVSLVQCKIIKNSTISYNLKFNFVFIYNRMYLHVISFEYDCNYLGVNNFSQKRARNLGI